MPEVAYLDRHFSRRDWGSVSHLFMGVLCPQSWQSVIILVAPTTGQRLTVQAAKMTRQHGGTLTACSFERVLDPNSVIEQTGSLVCFQGRGKLENSCGLPI